MKEVLVCLYLCVIAQAAVTRSPSNDGGRTCASAPCTYSVTCDGNSCKADEIQTALNEAQLGDTILLEAGRTWDIDRTLILYRKEKGEGYLTIRTSAPDELLPAGDTRITPTYTGLLPTLRLTVGSIRLMTVEQTRNAVEYYRFFGVHFTSSDRIDANDLIRLWAPGIHTDPSYTPNYIEFDRCILRGHPLRSVGKGIRFCVRNGTVKNSFFDEFKAQEDAQAISNPNGPGPVLIHNNYLSATGENIMTGGAIPDIPNLAPSDYTVEFNAFEKDPAQLLKDDWRPGMYVRKGRIARFGRGQYKALDSGVTSDNPPAFPLTTVNPAPRNPLTLGFVRPIDYDCSPDVCVNDNGIRWQLIAVNPMPWRPEMTIARGDLVTYTGPETNNTAVRFYAVRDGMTGTVPPFRMPIPPFNPTPDVCAPGFCFEDGTTAWQRYQDPPTIFWVVKNLLEYKSMDRSAIRWNFFSGSWVDGQTGWGISLKPENQDSRNTWVARTENVEIAYNVMTNVARPFNLQGRSSSGVGIARNWNIHNNLMYQLRPGGGSALQSTDDVSGLRFVHNTLELPPGGTLFSLSGMMKDSLWFVDNIVQRGAFGIKRTAVTEGNESLRQSYENYTVTNNVIEGIPLSIYPGGNFNIRFDDVGFEDRGSGNFKLRDSGPFKAMGTDGKDLGADTSMLPLITNLNIGVSDREALIAYELNEPIAHIPCVVEVSTDRDLSTFIPDMNPAVFARPDTDRHDAHIIIDRWRTIRVGKNAPLAPETTYWYRLHCGGALRTGSFRTAATKEGSATATLGSGWARAAEAADSVFEYGYSYSRSADAIQDSAVTDVANCDSGEGCRVAVEAQRGRTLYFRRVDRSGDGSVIAKQPVQAIMID